jgi:hypothetical protein
MLPVVTCAAVITVKQTSIVTTANILIASFVRLFMADILKEGRCQTSWELVGFVFAVTKLIPI